MEKKTFLGTIMRGDSWIWGIYWLLFFISIVEMFSASSRLAYRSVTNTDPAFHHMQILFGGFCAVLIFQSFSSKALRNWGVLLYLLGFCGLISLWLFGRTVNGAVRDVAGIQPAEVCKLGLMMFLCLLLTLKDETYYNFKLFRINIEVKRFWLYLIAAALVGLPILTQNLSTALIIGMATLAIMFIGGTRPKYILRLLFVGAVAAGIFLTALWGLHKVDSSREEAGQEQVNLGPLNRAHTWSGRIFDSNPIPLADQKPNDDNAQVIHAHMALANSYPFGKFIGNSQLRDLLPEAYSDYIYAIIFEETGFEGALFVMLLYLVLLGRCFWLSKKTEDQYVKLTIIALPLIMVIQALIHMGVCTDAMFVTGQPLPMISRGGSSILFTSISFGIILALSRIIKNGEVQKITAEQKETDNAEHKDADTKADAAEPLKTLA